VVSDAPYVVSRINPPDDPARLVLNLDWMVAGFTVLLALVVTALFGMLPALRASKVRPVSGLKGGDEPLSKAAWMQSMIAVQVAFCLVVLLSRGCLRRQRQRWRSGRWDLLRSGCLGERQDILPLLALKKGNPGARVRRNHRSAFNSSSVCENRTFP
jgi:hypothetical protein